MSKFMVGLRKAARRSQGMTEYIIIVAVIAILSIAIVTKYGDQIRNLFVSSGSELAGEKREVEDKMGDVEDKVDASLTDIGK